MSGHTGEKKNNLVEPITHNNSVKFPLPLQDVVGQLQVFRAVNDAAASAKHKMREWGQFAKYAHSRSYVRPRLWISLRGRRAGYSLAHICLFIHYYSRIQVNLSQRPIMTESAAYRSDSWSLATRGLIVAAMILDCRPSTIAADRVPEENG
jgi:hypothetical protein